MTIKKILLYIEPKAEIEKLTKFTMTLAKQSAARVFALSIIKRPIPNIKTRSEETAWKKLYEIEEDAFEAGVKISLLLEEIEPMNRKTLTQKLINLATTFQIDLVILASKAKLNFKTLTSGIAVPILIIPPQSNLTSWEV